MVDNLYHDGKMYSFRNKKNLYARYKIRFYMADFFIFYFYFFFNFIKCTNPVAISRLQQMSSFYQNTSKTVIPMKYLINNVGYFRCSGNAQIAS